MSHLASSTAVVRSDVTSTTNLQRRFAAIVIAVALVTSLAHSAAAELIYGIATQAAATSLLTWDSASPNNIQSGVFLSGLQSNETILGIDFRPATGALYGLGSSSRLYTINPTTGVATAVGGQFTTLLNGFSFGFDFNPMIDRIRVVSETNQNLVLDPNTGVVQTVAPNVAYGAGDPNVGVDPNVVDSAYTNNFPGAGSTTLFGIDTGLDVLVTQVAATGALTTIGPLGLNASAASGFDISGVTGIAYAALLPTSSSQSSLYTINLATGAATSVGVINGGIVINALTVAPIPEPATAATFVIGALVALAVRLRRHR
jgi:hypothetical protein